MVEGFPLGRYRGRQGLTYRSEGAERRSRIRPPVIALGPPHELIRCGRSGVADPPGICIGQGGRRTHMRDRSAGPRLIEPRGITGGNRMLRLPRRLTTPGSVVCVLTVLLVLTAGLVHAAAPTVVFDSTVAPPTPISFDISFVKNDIAAYILADRGHVVGVGTPPTVSNGAVDLFDATALKTTPPGALVFKGGIGTGGFVGNHPTCAVNRGCSGP